MIAAGTPVSIPETDVTEKICEAMEEKAHFGDG